MSIHKVWEWWRRPGSPRKPNSSSIGALLAVMWSTCCSAWGVCAERPARRKRCRIPGVPGRYPQRGRNGPRDPEPAGRGAHQAFPESSCRRTPAVQPISSPVPSDADLWPGELPFTAWGQHEPGTLDLRVFDQDEWWVDRNQTPHMLTDMSVLYVERVIDMLESLAEYYYLMTVRRDLLQRMGDEMLGRVPTDTVAESAGVTPLRDLTPQAWLEGSPLMRALRRRHARREDGATG